MSPQQIDLVLIRQLVYGEVFQKLVAVQLGHTSLFHISKHLSYNSVSYTFDMF